MSTEVPAVLRPGSECIKILTEATMLSNRSDFINSLNAYQDGIEMLLEASKSEQNIKYKTILQEKALQYISFAELLKEKIKKEISGKETYKSIEIKNNSKGFGYSHIIGPYCNQHVHRVSVEDPYVRSHHQINNFVYFVEIITKLCINLKKIHLTTTSSKESVALQTEAFKDLKASLAENNVGLSVEYSEVLHDRQIRFDTGWVVKIGRGLDYFKKPKYKFGLGQNDQDYRECYETNIDIIYIKN